jgi:hypothetical protein
MAAPCREQQSGAQWALAALVVVAFVAGLPPLVEVVAGSLARAGAGATKLPGLACSACGVVESVHEATLGSLKHDVSTVSGEGFAMFIALLSGKLGAGPVKIYEVAVYLQDGSTRVLLEGARPSWKPGDRVKVVMGRIRPAS